MRLETERLILRDYKLQDWEAVHVYGSVPEFSQYEMWGPNTIEDTKKFISDMIVNSKDRPRYRFEFAVELKSEKYLIGGCGLRRDSQESCIANMGWAINPKYQGVGIATEAARACLNFGFQELNLAVVYATCDTRNIASYRVMQKIGMKRVGHMIGDRKIDSKILDSYRYEISASEAVI
ncbi:MAG: GNAT family N-acetyltransferase [Pseudomonadota bacterium]